MSYRVQAAIADDTDVLLRVSVCAASQGVVEPRQWASGHMLTLAMSSGWAEAWESAEASEVERIGADETVITDGMILAAVQELLGGNDES